MQVAYCNDCKKQFQVDPKEQGLKDNIIKHYFICSHCKKEYIIYYSNHLIRKKQEKMKGLNNKYLSERDVNSKKALMTYKQMKKLKKELGKDMDKLEKDFKSD